MKAKNSDKPTYRNTRSKFYTKKTTSMEKDEMSAEHKSEETAEHWKQKGNAQFSKKSYNKAIQYYTKAISINPSESLYYSNRAKCHKIKGDLNLALKDAEEACQLNQDNIKAHYICGCILAQMGKKDHSKLKKAESRLKKALRLCTSHNKTQFSDEISIKIFRLKKLMWYFQTQKEKNCILIQTKSLLNNKELKKDQIDQMIHFLQKRKYQLSQKPKQIPDYLCCKMTLMLIEDPVTTESGFTYERHALEDHFKTNGYTDPITRKPISHTMIQNQALKQAIQDFLNENPWAFEHQIDQNYMNIVF